MRAVYARAERIEFYIRLFNDLPYWESRGKRTRFRHAATHTNTRITTLRPATRASTARPHCTLYTLHIIIHYMCAGPAKSLFVWGPPPFITNQTSHRTRRAPLTPHRDWRRWWWWKSRACVKRSEIYQRKAIKLIRFRIKQTHEHARSHACLCFVAVMSWENACMRVCVCVYESAHTCAFFTACVFFVQHTWPATLVFAVFFFASSTGWLTSYRNDFWALLDAHFTTL